MTYPISIPDVFVPVLTRLKVDAAAHFGRASVAFTPTDHQDRPGSQLLRVSVRSDADRDTLAELYVKVYKENAGDVERMRRRVLDDFATTRRVHDAMLSQQNVGAVPPVACYPDLLAIVTEEVQGPTLLEHLRNEASWFPSAPRLNRLLELMGTVGQWVRVFQSAQEFDELVTVDSLRSYIDLRLQRLVSHQCAPFDEHYRARVLRHVDRLGAQIDRSDLVKVQVHADLALGNILVSGSRIVVLDFAMAGTGTRFHDLTRLAVQIDLLGVKPQHRPGTVRRLQQALLSGFDPTLDQRRPILRLLTLVHRINHFGTLSLSRPGFAERFYNSVTRRRHLQWIDEELSLEASATAVQ